jgi:amidase
MRIHRHIVSALTVLTLSLSLPTVSSVEAQAQPGLDLDAATIPSLQARMDRGQLSSAQLTLAYLGRIHVIDPKIHAVIALNPSAVIDAAASDLRRHNGVRRGQLDGIPVLLKDNIDTRDMPTTAGSRALAGQRPARDADLVTRLRAAGAVILGKTNLSEWANFRSILPTSGWSGIGGQTNNPYVLDRNPCGSSAGSAAAVAASLAQVAIGTETDGSIQCPASVNGIVGLKPSVDLVSQAGLVPISPAQDVAGPLARHVIDAAITLTTLRNGGNIDYAAGLASAELSGKRIGVYRLAGADPDVDRTVQAAVRTLQAQGATVVEVALPYQDQIFPNEAPALLSEFKHYIDQYLAARPGTGPHSLADVVTFNSNDPVELSEFGQEIFQVALTAAPLIDPTYQQQRATATTLAQRSIDETITANNLDAIMAPTAGPAWVTNYATGDDAKVSSARPAAVAGYPNISVPAGSKGPLPLGVSFFAGNHTEKRLLGIASAFERASAARQAPQFTPTCPDCG